MKNLYLVRHAKTVHGHSELKDFDRYLKPRGISDTQRMADYLKTDFPLPQLIFSSPARRAIQTAKIFAEKFDYDPELIIQDKSIYFGGTGQLLAIIKAIQPNVNIVMLIGHNPTVHETVNLLIEKPVDHFPTGCVAVIQFETDDWMKIQTRTGKLFVYEKPKNLR